MELRNVNRIFKKLVKKNDLDIIFDFTSKLDYHDCLDILDEAYNLSTDISFRESIRMKKRNISFSADVDATCEIISTEGARHFIQMINAGNTKAVNKLVRKGYADIRVPETVLNPIFVAIKEQNLDILKNIISHCHYNINELYYIMGNTPVSIMEFALQLFNPDILKCLLNNGMNTGQRIYGLYFTPLCFCCAKLRSTQIAEILITHGCDLDLADKNGNTPLHWASTYEDYKMIKLLLSNGANPYIRNFQGLQPLDIVIKKKNIRILHSFMKKCNYTIDIRYDVDWIYKYKSPEFVESLSMKTYKYLLAHEPEQLKNPKDEAVLDDIRYKYKFELMKRIVRRLINRKKFCEINLMSVAVHFHVKDFEVLEENNEELIDQLIDDFHGYESGNLLVKCVEYNYFDTFQQIFHWNVFARAFGAIDAFVTACMAGKTRFVRYILENDATVLEFAEHQKETILIHVCCRGYLDVVNLLIEKGKFDVNGSDADGNTPLYMAIETKNTELISYLLAKGANDKRYIPIIDDTKILSLYLIYKDSDEIEITFDILADYE